MSSYYGDNADWYNSQVPNLFSPGLSPDPRSTGCLILPPYSR